MATVFNSVGRNRKYRTFNATIALDTKRQRSNVTDLTIKSDTCPAHRWLLRSDKRYECAECNEVTQQKGD